MTSAETTHERAPRPAVKIVEQIYAALRRRDIAALFELCAPDIVIDQSGELPWGGHYEGHEGFKAFFARLIAAIDSAVTLDSFIDAGDEVVVLGHTRGTVNANGGRFDVAFAHVWTVQGGQVTRVRYYIDNPTMLAALP